ncbi:MAG: hypothetical protein ACOYEW_07870 [Anaerolineae bacterium]|jgi:hypothetical protein
MRWLDTHIHVSAFGSDGSPRGDILPELLAVVERDGADLRLVLSCDTPEVKRMRTDPEWLERGNRFLHELCVRSGGRFYAACLVSPQFPEGSEQVLRLAAEEWGFVQYGEVLVDVVEDGLTRPEVIASVEQATSYGLPIHTHVSTNYEKGIAHMAQLFALAEAVPQARYLVAHTIGGRMSDYYIDQLAPRLARGENFWVEIRDHQQRPGPVSGAEGDRGRETGGRHGLDHPGGAALPALRSPVRCAR